MGQANSKVLFGPVDTDFGIARVVKLSNGSTRVESFDEASKSWVPSTNPALTIGEIFDSKPVSEALAGRIGIPDDSEAEVDTAEWRAGLVRSAIESKYSDYTDAIVRRLSNPKKGVTALGAIDENSRTSGDDSEMEDVWEEYKAQVQQGESAFFGAYKDTILLFCEELAASLTHAERLLLWLHSEGYYRWERENEEPDDTTLRGDISEELYSRLWKRAADEELAESAAGHEGEVYADDEVDDEVDDQPEARAAIEEAKCSQETDSQRPSRPDQAREPLNPDRHGLIFVQGVGRKLATAKALQAESLRVQQIAGRWALGAPDKVNQLEADGFLLQRLKEQADLEETILAGARVSGAFSGVSDQEILRQHGISELPE